MNFPLPSVSTSVSASAGSYVAGSPLPSGFDAGASGTAFANLLSGSGPSRRPQSSGNSSGSNDGTSAQAATAQTSAGDDNLETDAAKRARLKKAKAGKDADSTHSIAGPAANPPSMAVAISPPAPADNSAASTQSDGTGSSEDSVNTSRQISPLAANSLGLQGTDAGGLAAAANAATDPLAGTQGAPSEVNSKIGTASFATDGIAGPDQAATLNSKLPTAGKSDANLPSSAAKTSAPAADAASGLSSAKNDLSPKSTISTSASANAGLPAATAKNAPLQATSPDTRAASAASGPANIASDANQVVDHKKPKDAADSVGIAGAKAASGMSKPTTTAALASTGRTPEADISTGAAVSSASCVAAGASAPQAPAASELGASSVSHAAAAVEATLDSIEHMRDAAHSSVELKLSFANDAQLGVRVSLRDGVVETTFRTDSAELRQALTSEWRQQAPAMAASASDRSLRIADPVFAAGSGSSGSAETSTGGQGNFQQAQTSAQEHIAEPVFRRPSLQASAAASSASAPPRLPTSLRLNVFA
jgi:hypothetical protein